MAKWHPEERIQCAKCGGIAGWDGPRYVGYMGGYAPCYRWVEYLTFVCQICGYERREPTKDAPREEPKVLVVPGLSARPWWRIW